MPKIARKFCSVVTLASTFALAIVFIGTGVKSSVGQTDNPGIETVAPIDQPQPEWRYTRFGWQDANQWASLSDVIHPPQRGVDEFHPAALAGLIVFSVLGSMLWASNEWEVAQLFGASKD
jgi:hypothetical protein